MKSSSNNWIQYPIMLFVSLVVSWLVFSILSSSENESKEVNNQIENVKSDEIVESDNTLVSDVIKKRTNVMGIALNRTGFYILPYSVSNLKNAFGSVGKMSNKLPLTVIWDDREYGLAIANFADKNFEKLPSIPYYFSKSDFHLGEELFFVFSSAEAISINQGLVIEDDADAYLMKVHLDLESNVYGAIVLNNSGAVVGICDKAVNDGIVNVIKSKAIFQIVKDMNKDKGVSFISLPSQNYLRNKSNAQRIESLKPFVSWYSAD
jgi:hypothetical protein